MNHWGWSQLPNRLCSTAMGIMTGAAGTVSSLPETERLRHASFSWAILLSIIGAGDLPLLCRAGLIPGMNGLNRPELKILLLAGTGSKMYYGGYTTMNWRVLTQRRYG